MASIDDIKYAVSDAGAAYLAWERGSFWTCEQDPAFPFVVLEHGQELVEPPHLDEKRQSRPNRAKGTVQLGDAVSFVDYVNRYKGDGTLVLVHEQTLTALFNHHEPAWRETALIPEGPGDPIEQSAVPQLAPEGEQIAGTLVEHVDVRPGWGDFRAVFTVEMTPEWLAWSAIDGKPLAQQPFGDFIEEHIPQIAEPDGNTLLDVARNLAFKKDLQFKSAQRVENGTVQFEYIEKVESANGSAGRLEIPSELVLALQPFRGAPAYRVEARLRWTLNEGNVWFTLKLGEKKRLALEEAYDEVLAAVREGIGVPVLRGRI